MELDADILEYYGRGKEESRLRQGLGRLEFWRTRDVLRRVLPAPRGRLLDVGGGCGIHAAWLASDGWDVLLIDPVPAHVQQASVLSGVTARVGDARALDSPDACADVVLLLGPLYHLPDRADRQACLTEASRVLRPGGTVAAATINRYAALHDQLNRGGWFEPWRRARLEATAATGVVHPGGDFTTAYLHHPAEIAAEMSGAGLTVTGQYGVEGAVALMGNVDAYLDDPVKRDAVLEALRIVESDPALLGVSSHLLTVAVTPVSRC